MSVWIGAGLAVFGQFIGATSMLLMKRAAVLEADLPFFRRRTFQFAFALFFFNTVILDAVIYALAPLTVVAPQSRRKSAGFMRGRTRHRTS